MSENSDSPSGTTQKSPPSKRPWIWAGVIASIASLITACKTAPDPAPGPTPSASNATTALAYRKDGAKHLYARNPERIYKGTLPPMLYAIGVLQVNIDTQGRVTRLHWMRAPSHAPEVVAEIERTVRAAAPFPAPLGLGKVTYTDTWLWDKSGQFQLDTLTEGQRGQ